MRQHNWNTNEKAKVLEGVNELGHDWEGIRCHYLPHLNYYYLRKLQIQDKEGDLKGFIVRQAKSNDSAFLSADDRLIEKVREALLNMY